MKYIVGTLLVVIALAIGAASWSIAQQPPAEPADKRPTSLTPLMRMKLEKAKLILEGLTLEEYDKIAKSARQLKLLSMESGWNVLQTEEYEMHSKDFRRTTELIEQAAKNKDVNRAALGYVALTVRCVECHSYMRKLGKGIGLSADKVDSDNE
jgi:hypothetical protein